MSAISSVAVLRREVVILGEVLGDVVDLPALRVELGQLLVGDRRAEPLAGLRERRPGHGQTARQPS